MRPGSVGDAGLTSRRRVRARGCCAPTGSLATGDLDGPGIIAPHRLSGTGPVLRLMRGRSADRDDGSGRGGPRDGRRVLGLETLLRTAEAAPDLTPPEEAVGSGRYRMPMTNLRAQVATAVIALGALAPVVALGRSPSPDDSPGQTSRPAAVGAYRPGMMSIVLEPFTEGLSRPLFVTPDGTGSGELYGVEQGGVVRVITPDGSVGDSPFLDISDRVQAGGEQGLLGLTFHPDYAANGRLFVYYTRRGDESQVVSEFHASDGVADPTSERVVLEMADFAPNHNGGMLAFDAEGMLLIGTGDGGGGGDPEHTGQDVTRLLAKLLRIDVDGAAPYGVPSNDPGGRLGADALPEIRATGLRNPWRFSVDRLTGDVFIGDVGQGAWEEIDVLPAGQGGANFGWSTMEGPACYGADTCDRVGLTLPGRELPALRRVHGRRWLRVPGLGLPGTHRCLSVRRLLLG